MALLPPLTRWTPGKYPGVYDPSTPEFPTVGNSLDAAPSPSPIVPPPVLQATTMAPPPLPGVMSNPAGGMGAVKPDLASKDLGKGLPLPKTPPSPPEIPVAPNIQTPPPQPPKMVGINTQEDASLAQDRGEGGPSSGPPKPPESAYNNPIPPDILNTFQGGLKGSRPTLEAYKNAGIPVPPDQDFDYSSSSQGVPAKPEAKTAMERYQELKRPMRPGTKMDDQGNVVDDPTTAPKWYQRLAAAAAGAAGGWTNADGRTHIDPKTISAAVEGIVAPGFAQKTAAYEAAQQDIQQQAAMEAKHEQLEATREYRKSIAEQREEQNRIRSDAEKAKEEQNKAAVAKVKSDSYRKFIEDNITTPFKGDAQYMDAPTPEVMAKLNAGPIKYSFHTNSEDPSKGWLHPEATQTVSTDLAPYAGVAAGSTIPWTRYKTAMDKFGDSQKGVDVASSKAKDLKAEAQIRLEAGKEQGLTGDALRSFSLTGKLPDALADLKKQNLLSLIATRSANAGLGIGGASGVARNPTLAPDQRDPGVITDMNPGARAVLQQLVDYKLPLPTGTALRTPYWQGLLERAAQYDPSFDASQYANRQKLRADFMSGKAATNINALNTVTEHIDRLESNWKKLNNTNILPGVINGPLNAVGSVVSSSMQDRLNKFKTDQDAVANELMRVWRQVGASTDEIKAWSQRISPNMAPEAQQGAIGELYHLINGKLQALKSQYEVGMGRPVDFKMLQPVTQKRFEAHGVNVEDLTHGAAYPGSAAVSQAPPGVGGVAPRTITEQQLGTYMNDPRNKGITRQQAIDLFKGEGFELSK